MSKFEYYYQVLINIKRLQISLGYEHIIYEYTSRQLDLKQYFYFGIFCKTYQIKYVNNVVIN